VKIRKHLAAMPHAVSADRANSFARPGNQHDDSLPENGDVRGDSNSNIKKVTHARPLRIALYSHDTMGLGHARRNLTIARALAGPETRANVLMITGANVVSSLAMPRGVDCLTLPAIHKGSDGQYQSRSLDLPLGELTSTRSKTIRGALDAYDPDVLIVDNVPRGANAELDETLRFLHARGSTHCVLGLRDVLDSPETVAREWQQRRNEENGSNVATRSGSSVTMMPSGSTGTRTSWIPCRNTASRRRSPPGCSLPVIWIAT
jgi:hypothetical protein